MFPMLIHCQFMYDTANKSSLLSFLEMKHMLAATLNQELVSKALFVS